MIRYREYSITFTGEYPVVNKITTIKSGVHKGEELATPTYFPRDLLGALQILQRLTTTDSSRECKDLQAAIKAIEGNHKDLLEYLKEVL